MTTAPRRPRRHPTRKLHLEQGRKLSGAFNRARQIGFPLNCLVTLHWGLADSGVEPFDRWVRLCEAMGKWLARMGCPPTWAFVREKGLAELEHMHLAIHVPKNRSAEQVKAAFERWIAVGAAHVDPAAVDVKLQRTPSMVALMRYLLKGGDSLVRRSFSVPKHYEGDQGIIHGKRLGVSRNLDSRARADALLEDDTSAVAAE